MKIIERYIENQIVRDLGKNKVIIISGTRRVGKTFLLQNILNQYKGKYLLLNGEDLDVQSLLNNRTIANYQRIIQDNTLLAIDEAQSIKEIGANLKLMIDSFPTLTIIATGSSSFDLMNQTGEPLTGRLIQYYLYPISQIEFEKKENILATKKHFEERLIFGAYPEVNNLTTLEEKSGYLLQLVQSYLLKDILNFNGLKHSDKISSLLRLIAFQVGSEVSTQEIGTQLGMNRQTVESYLDLLSKVFIIFKLPSYSNNLRKEISKSAKWYFFDNGVRNAIINDFRLPALRNDMGLLWENYIVSERIKKNQYLNNHTQHYFWRTYDQQEIDLIEYKNGELVAYEIKFKANKKTKIPGAFAKSYPKAVFSIINTENYLDFIGM